MGNIMRSNKKTLTICLVVVAIGFGYIIFNFKNDETKFFNSPILAVESVYSDYNNEEIVILDSTIFHTGSYLFILYNADEDSVTKVIVGKKSDNKYYIEERVPWFVIGSGKNQFKIEQAVKGVHEIEGETKKFYVWKGSFTIDDLMLILDDFDKIDISNIREPYKDIYLVFY